MQHLAYLVQLVTTAVNTHGKIFPFLLKEEKTEKV